MENDIALSILVSALDSDIWPLWGHGQMPDRVIVPHIHWMDPTTCLTVTAKIKFYIIDGFRTPIIQSPSPIV
jgi:hypothetical protein